MLKSDIIRNKKSIQEMQNRYVYRENVPPRGFLIDGKPALTQIDPGKVGDYVILLVRDALCAYGKDPSELIADRLENAELIGKSGMFTSWSGTYKGARITAVSGGSGAPEMEMIMYDFLEYTNASTFLRLGGSGGFGDEVEPGDIVIASGAVRDEGMTKAYIDAAYPATSSYEVVLAMVQAAEEQKLSYHVGVTVSCDSDYVGGGRPGVGGYMQPWNIEHAGIYNRAGCLNGDRESSAIITLANLFGRRGGSICSVSDNMCTGKRFKEGIGHDATIDLVLEGLANLYHMDQEKGTSRYWYPTIGEKR